MRTALWKGQVSEMLAVRAILTPEQRAKLREGKTSAGEGKPSPAKH
jgi:Spy/CpxP family protein refolding chaperone